MSNMLYVDGAFPQRTPASLDKLRQYDPALVVSGSGFGPDEWTWLRQATSAPIFVDYNPLSIKPWRTLRHFPSRRVWDMNSAKSYAADRYFKEWLTDRNPAFSGKREFLAPLNDPEYVQHILTTALELAQEYSVHIWHEWSLLTRVPSWYTQINPEYWTDEHANGVLRYLRGLGMLPCMVGSNIITRSMVEDDGVAAGDWLDVVKIEWNAKVPHDYLDPNVDEANRGPRWGFRHQKTVVLEVWDDGTLKQNNRWEAAKDIAREIRAAGGVIHLCRYKKAADGDWPDHRSWPEVE